MRTEIYKKFSSSLLATFKGKLLFNEPMSNHTSLRVGGITPILAYPNDIEDLLCLVKHITEAHLNYRLLGNGTNTLFVDDEIDCIIIKLNRLNQIRILRTENNIVLIYAEAGVLNNALLQFCLKNKLSGFEFAVGIPGTVGGGLYMNAGTPSGSFGDITQDVQIIDSEFNLKIISHTYMQFNYRSSSIKEGGIITSATLKLHQMLDTIKIENYIRELLYRRKQTQPIEFPNCGSVFKNPNGLKAGKIIEDLGFKGYRVGNAEVSTKHANFIINRGGAKAKDILSIIDMIKKTALEKNNVILETEVKIIKL